MAKPQGKRNRSRPNKQGKSPLFDLPKELLLDVIYYLDNHDLNRLMAFTEIRRRVGNEFALYTDAEETHFPNFTVVFRSIPGRGFVDQPGINNTRRTRIILELNHTDDVHGTFTPAVMNDVETRVNMYPQIGKETNSVYGGMTNFGMFHTSRFFDFFPKTKTVSIDNVQMLDLFGRILNPFKLLEIPEVTASSFTMCSVSEEPFTGGPPPRGPRYKISMPKLEKLYVNMNYKDVQKMIDFDSPALKELNLMNITDYPVVEGRYPYLESLKIESPEIVKLSNLSLPSVTSIELPVSLISIHKTDFGSLKELTIKTDAPKFYMADVQAPKLTKLELNVKEIAVFKDVSAPELTTLKLGEGAFVLNGRKMVDFACLKNLQRLETADCVAPLHHLKELSSMSVRALSMISLIGIPPVKELQVTGVTDVILPSSHIRGLGELESLSFFACRPPIDIASVLENQPNLKKLAVYGCRIDYTGTRIFAKELEELTLLDPLSKLFSEGMAGTYFPKLSKLTIGNPGSQALVDYVAMPLLKELTVNMPEQEHTLDVSGLKKLRKVVIKTVGQTVRVKSKGCAVLEDVEISPVGVL